VKQSSITLDTGLGIGNYSFKIKAVARQSNYNDKIVESSIINFQVIKPSNAKLIDASN
jgi:hypothetical protein